MTTLTLSPLIVSSCAWSIVVDEVPTVTANEGITPEIMQLNVLMKSSQQPILPLATVLSVVGACLFSALVLFVVLLSVGLCVHYKKKRSMPSTSGEQSEPICEWLTRQGSVHAHLSQSCALTHTWLHGTVPAYLWYKYMHLYVCL